MSGFEMGNGRRSGRTIGEVVCKSAVSVTDSIDPLRKWERVKISHRVSLMRFHMCLFDVEGWICNDVVNFSNEVAVLLLCVRNGKFWTMGEVLH